MMEVRIASSSLRGEAAGCRIAIGYFRIAMERFRIVLAGDSGSPGDSAFAEGRSRDAAGRDSGVIPGDRIGPRQFRIEILPCRIAIPLDSNAIRPCSNAIRPYSNAIWSCSNVISSSSDARSVLGEEIPLSFVPLVWESLG
jgi:hypothetical protein